jgi:hypothetical protein
MLLLWPHGHSVMQPSSVLLLPLLHWANPPALHRRSTGDIHRRSAAQRRRQGGFWGGGAGGRRGGCWGAGLRRVGPSAGRQSLVLLPKRAALAPPFPWGSSYGPAVRIHVSRNINRDQEGLAKMAPHKTLSW